MNYSLLLKMDNRQYFCCDNFDSWDWKYLLKNALTEAAFVEFNQLPLDEKLPAELEWLNEYRSDSVANQKLYTSGTQHRFELTSPVKEFVLKRDFSDWQNSFFEDISLFNSDETEILATISHERYVIKLLSQNERLLLKEKGIDFWCEWETLEDVKRKTQSRDRKSIVKSILEILGTVFR